MSIISKEDVIKTVRVTKRGATVKSDAVAKVFGKSHKMILRKIRGFCDELVEQNYAIKLYFIDTTYCNAKGKDYTRFELTRKGFDLLGLSLTGKEALKYKLWYIDEFHSKSEVISKNKQLAYENNENPLWIGFRQQGKEIHTKFTDAVNEYLLPQRVAEKRETNQFVSRYISSYTKLIYRILNIEVPKGVNLNRDAMDMRLLFKVETLEEKIATLIINKAKQDIHYKDIYQQIKSEIEKQVTPSAFVSKQ